MAPYKSDVRDSIRFSIDNLFTRVSLTQFMGLATKLDEAMHEANPNIATTVLVTTVAEDYHTWGSVTVPHPQASEAAARRERYELSEVDESVWERAYKTSVIIDDDTRKDAYLILMSTELRQPRSIMFYGHGLDEISYQKLESLKEETGLLQTIGRGFPPTSSFNQAYVRGMRDSFFAGR